MELRPYQQEAIAALTPTSRDSTFSLFVGEIMGKCIVEDCYKDNGKGGKGYCGMHWQRIKRGGSIDYICSEEERRRRSRLSQPNLGQCKPTTYKKLLGRHEHRVVAEQSLGRKLEAYEHVHHLDGNKHNNSIENLAVLTRIEHLRLHGKNFNREQILDIRTSKLSQDKLAKIYGCSQSNISAIRRREIYQEIE